MSANRQLVTAFIFLALSLSTLPVSAAPDIYQRPGDSPLLAAFSGLFGNGQFHKSYALVIGVGDYDAVKKLDAPKRDAQRVRDFLVKEAGFDYVETLTDGDATKEQIALLMDTDLPARVGANDRFLFYFSGHGATRDLGFGDSRGYLLLKKSHLKAWNEMIDMPQIKAWAENLSRARHVLFVLDACFSGLAAVQVKSEHSKRATLERLSRPSSYILTAGVDREESYAVGGSSLFTQAFLLTARGQPEPPADGIVSLQDMIPRINRYIDARSVELGGGIKMTPQLYKARIKNNEGEFFFLLPQLTQRPVAQVAVLKNHEANTAASSSVAPPPRQPISRPGPERRDAMVPSSEPTNAASSRVAPQPRQPASHPTPERLATMVPKTGATSAASSSVAPPPRQPASRPLSEHLAATVPKTTFRDCGDCPEMVWVPAVSFSEIGGDLRERATNMIGRSFAVSRYPITRGQWRAYLQQTRKNGSNNCYGFNRTKVQAEQKEEYTWLNPGFDQDDDHPVVCVTWQEAKDYAAWLSKKPGGHFYKLPSAVEYQYLEYAGSLRPYPWGSDTRCKYDATNAILKAGHGGSSGTYATCSDGFTFTSPVDHFPPSPLGIYDTVGNVLWWTQDCHHDSYEGASTDCALAGRVVRGGSWLIYTQRLRSVDRVRNDNAYSIVGFRVTVWPRCVPSC